MTHFCVIKVFNSRSFQVVCNNNSLNENNVIVKSQTILELGYFENCKSSKGSLDLRKSIE